MFKAVYRYWTSDESNIFRDYKDALFGFVVLVLLPFLSLIAVWNTSGFAYKFDNTGTAFWAYSFPLISVSISGLSDAFARLEFNAEKNAKLVVRIVINLVAGLLAGIMGWQWNLFLRLLPAILLVINGLLLIYEIATNIIFTIGLSPLAAKE